MKRALFVVGALLLLGSASPAQGSVTFGVFYSSLDAYGEWLPLDGGVYGWRPAHVMNHWRPYWMGRWVWTVDGWYWLSDEPWGWATYHYGRWYYDDWYGWIWIPGYDWAPAWVEWRYGGSTIGWAPLGPYAIWDFRVGIVYRYRWATPDTWWSFADCRYITSPALHRHVYRTEDNRRFIGRTRDAGSVGSRDGRIAVRGPQREQVERRAGIRVERVDVVDLGERGERMVREGDRQRIGVYRPRIDDRRVDVMEKPARVREENRRVRLETGETDVRVRSLDRARGVDVEKADRAVTPERIDRRAPVETPSRNAEPPARRTPPERSIERRPPAPPVDRPGRIGGRGQDRRSDVPREHPDVRRSRPPKEELRGRPAERLERRPPEVRRERREEEGKRGRR